MVNARSLRGLLGRSTPLVSASAWDCFTALLLEDAGFPVLHVSGASVSGSRLGLPDLGFLGLPDLADTVRSIARTVRAPLLVDADTGYGGVLQAIHTAEVLAAAGAAAIHLEDQVFPKRCGHLAGKEVVPAEEFAAKIRGVVENRPDPDFLIVARTDALAVEGVDAAIDRANRYLDAGADIAFVEAARTVAEVARIGQEVRGPKLYNLATGGVGPELGIDELGELGFAWIVVPGVALGAVLREIRAVGKRVLAERNDSAVSDTGFSPGALAELFDVGRWNELDSRYALHGEATRHRTPGDPLHVDD
jgi:2-methylisocitrate lyase-like PEP mutase family enzyme